MGLFTIYDDQQVDQSIKRDLDVIVDTLRVIPNVRSIILGGGFGRGEGSVLIVAGKIKPINDYDIFLIVEEDFDADVSLLVRSLKEKIEIRLIDLIPVNISALPSLPATQFFYDLKFGGKLLWGEDALQVMPDFRAEMILRESANTVLCNRLICAIEAFSEKFERVGLTPEESFFLVNQTGKVIFSCVESLLIASGNYSHLASVRQLVFARTFPNMTNLIRLNNLATEFKLMPKEGACSDPVGYWKSAVSEYLTVMQELLAPSLQDSKRSLWELLRDGNVSVTNTKIERVEIMLLLAKQMPSRNWNILFRANLEMASVLKRPVFCTRWEQLRKLVADTWHRLH